MFGFGFWVTRNDISPAVSRLLATAKDKRPVLRAMGNTFKSVTEGTFNSVGAAYRPKPWPALKDPKGVPSNLQRSTTLCKSFHLTITEESAVLANPMKYAAIHQFGSKGLPGGVIKPKKAKFLRWKNSQGDWVVAKQVVMPERPFFPVADGKLTPAAERLVMRSGERVIARQAQGTA